MMSAIRNERVMWVNVKSLVASGPYAETNMQNWNRALLAACAKYPNMRIFDWASVVRDNWFMTTGSTTPRRATRPRPPDRQGARQGVPVGSETGSPNCVVH